ncbi:MAG: hypothetical protein WBP76_03450 [Leptotrichiaceae bacterium]|jgi:hypothetical protein|nr:hypothetical protein [Leptotrichiaceae bacterium]MBP6168098.1 hypothetical protein [Leptotrichiaceae bacterium]MBP7026248.1 hypothetical protein [Leptotrichiaceae bacterium]MBP8636740.1 hypothetical protein [Leptotrichiaceae bacterium]MBP9539308.1 hypothetical protein [Leptotrichiaceae bacterium]
MEQILKRAKILNILLIVLIIVVSIATHISNIMIYESAAAQDFQIILLQGYRVVSLVLLLLIIMIFIKMRKNKLEGGEFLLASGIVNFIFSLISMFLGIVIILLCSFSLRKLREQREEIEILNESREEKI